MYDLDFNLLLSADLTNGQSTGSRFKNPEGTSSGKIVHRDGKCYKPVLKQVHADLSATYEWVEVDCPDTGGGETDGDSNYSGGSLNYNGGSSGNPDDYGDGTGLNVDDSPGGGINTGGDSGGSVPGFDDLPQTREEREAYLENLLEEDPFLLIDIDCDELIKWKNVATTNVPYIVSKGLDSLESLTGSLSDVLSLNDDWMLQDLSTGSGTAVNLDYFSVTTTLPDGIAPEKILEHVRTEFLDKLNSAVFTPHPNLQGESDRWNNPNSCLGSILSIDMFDDGSVICIQKSLSSWTFTTIQDPRNFSHPVSGNRKFGFTNNNNGSITFYTRGVDRMTNSIESTARDLIEFSTKQDLLDLANDVWKSYQSKIAGYVRKIGGEAVIDKPITERPNYDKLNRVLLGQEPMSSYKKCN